MDKRVEEVVDAVAGAVEEGLRQLALSAVILLSLGVVLAAVIVSGVAGATVGAAVGLAGVGAALVPRLRHWRRGPTWIMFLVVALVELFAMLLVVAAG